MNYSNYITQKNEKEKNLLEAFTKDGLSGLLDYFTQNKIGIDIANILGYAAQRGYLNLIKTILVQHPHFLAHSHNFIFNMCTVNYINPLDSPKPMLDWLLNVGREYIEILKLSDLHINILSKNFVSDVAALINGLSTIDNMGFPAIFYAFILNKINYGDLTPEQAKTLLEYQAPNGQNLLRILAYINQWPIIHALIEEKLVTTAMLLAVPMHENSPRKSINALWFMAINKQWNLIHTLNEQHLVTTEMLLAKPMHENTTSKGINALLFMAINKQWHLIHTLNEQHLVTTEMLLASPMHENTTSKGINALLFMAINKQWHLIHTLNEQHLVTTEMLLAAPTHENNKAKGINALWLMACHRQLPLISTLIEQKLITTEMLLTAPTHENNTNKGINALWLMIEHKQWPIIDTLIKQELITTEMLLAAPTQENNLNKGINALLLMASNEQWPLISTLNEQHLVTTEMLLAAPTHENNISKGINTLRLIAINRQWNLIHTLSKQHLITTEMLLAAPTQENNLNKGINALLLMASNEQWPLISTLNEQHLVTTEMLLAAPTHENNENKGINALWLMANNHQWPLISTLIKQKLITTEMLLAAPTHENNENKGINALWLMANNHQWPLISTLIKQKLITTEMLLAAPLSENDLFRSINALWLMANNHQWPLISTLIEQHLVTTQMLLAASTHENSPGKGINALFFMANNRQWPLISTLNEQHLVTAEMLLAAPTHENCLDKGKNALLIIIKREQWALFFKLLQKEIITIKILDIAAIQRIKNSWDVLPLLLRKKLTEIGMIPPQMPSNSAPLGAPPSAQPPSSSSTPPGTSPNIPATSFETFGIGQNPPQPSQQFEQAQGQLAPPRKTTKRSNPDLNEPPTSKRQKTSEQTQETESSQTFFSQEIKQEPSQATSLDLNDKDNNEKLPGNFYGIILPDIQSDHQNTTTEIKEEDATPNRNRVMTRNDLEINTKKIRDNSRYNKNCVALSHATLRWIITGEAPLQPAPEIPSTEKDFAVIPDYIEITRTPRERNRTRMSIVSSSTVVDAPRLPAPMHFFTGRTPEDTVHINGQDHPIFDVDPEKITQKSVNYKELDKTLMEEAKQGGDSACIAGLINLGRKEKTNDLERGKTPQPGHQLAFIANSKEVVYLDCQRITDGEGSALFSNFAAESEYTFVGPTIQESKQKQLTNGEFGETVFYFYTSLPKVKFDSTPIPASANYANDLLAQPTLKI